MSALRKMRFEGSLPEGRLIYLPERRRQELARGRQIEEVRALVAAPVVATVSSASSNDVAVTTLSITKPASTVDTDLLVFVSVAQVSGTNITMPAGWTSLGAISTGFVTNSGYKVAASEGASYSFTYVSPTIYSIVMLRVTGASSTTAFVFDVLGTATGTSLSTVTAAAIANKRANDLVIALFTETKATASGGSITSGWTHQVSTTGNVSGNCAIEVISRNAAVDANVTTGTASQTWTGNTGTGHTRQISFSPQQSNVAASSAGAQATCSVTVAEVFTSANAASGSQATSSETVAEVFTSANAASGSQATSSETVVEAFSGTNDSAGAQGTSSESVAEVFSSANASNGAGASSTSTVAEVFNSPVASIAIQAAANLTGGETFTTAMASVASQGALAALVATFVGVLVSSLGQQGSSALSGIEGFVGTLTPAGQPAASLVIGFEGFGVAVVSQGAQALLSALIYRYWRTDGSHGQTVQRVFSGFVTQHVFGTTPNPTARKTNA